jgi:AraC-like DNA-binding protein
MDERRYSTPRNFLGKFMFFAVLVYLSHFLFFSPLPEIYVFFDALYQYASLMVFPMYYIYFRLLTVDEKFSFKKHGIYLLAPTLLFIFYCVGILLTPCNEYKFWLFNKYYNSSLFGIKYLNVISQLIRFTFIIQVVATVIGNYLLIQKHGEKAAQFYSDMEDSSTKNVVGLNISLIITGLSSLILGALGRNFFTHEITGIAIASVIFSSMLFIIGWLGNKQKTLNPTYDFEPVNENFNLHHELSSVGQKKLLERLLHLFTNEKIHLNQKLNIQDIAQTIGTNRSYISTVINQHFNMNFCSFVNNFRVQEMEKVLQEHPEYTLQLLAESCGFGSIDSLRRAVFAKTGLTLPQWKSQVLSETQKDITTPQNTI